MVSEKCFVQKSISFAKFHLLSAKFYRASKINWHFWLKIYGRQNVIIKHDIFFNYFSILIVVVASIFDGIDQMLSLILATMILGANAAPGLLTNDINGFGSYVLPGSVASLPRKISIIICLILARLNWLFSDDCILILSIYFYMQLITMIMKSYRMLWKCLPIVSI